MFYAVGFPKASGTAVVLLFDDDFLEVKASIFKYTAHFTAHRYDMPLFAGITHQYSTKFKFHRLVEVPSAEIADKSTFHFSSISVKYISL